jgi:fructose-specific phosphotransferase system IIC component
MHANTTRALITIFLGIILMVPIITSAAAFAIGDRIQTTANLNVRATPSLSGHLLCIQPSGTLGTVIAGLIVIPLVLMTPTPGGKSTTIPAVTDGASKTTSPRS